VTYIVQADLESRISPLVVRQILDDDLDGVPDAAALAQVIADAEGYVEGFLRGNYDLTAIRALGVAAPNEIKRLCLDVAVAYLVDRHPEYVRADGRKMMERARRDLMDLRKSVTRLDTVGTLEPAANQTHITESGDPDEAEAEEKFFIDRNSMGIF